MPNFLGDWTQKSQCVTSLHSIGQSSQRLCPDSCQLHVITGTETKHSLREWQDNLWVFFEALPVSPCATAMNLRLFFAWAVPHPTQRTPTRNSTHPEACLASCLASSCLSSRAVAIHFCLCPCTELTHWNSPLSFLILSLGHKRLPPALPVHHFSLD